MFGLGSISKAQAKALRWAAKEMRNVIKTTDASDELICKTTELHAKYLERQAELLTNYGTELD